MMTISANPAVAAITVEPGPAASGVAIEGDGFMAIMADVAKGGARASAASAATDFAKQIVTVGIGARPTGKAAEPVDSEGEAGGEKAAEAPIAAAADTPGAVVGVPQIPAPATAPAPSGPEAEVATTPTSPIINADAMPAGAVPATSASPVIDAVPAGPAPATSPVSGSPSAVSEVRPTASPQEPDSPLPPATPTATIVDSSASAQTAPLPATTSAGPARGSVADSAAIAVPAKGAAAMSVEGDPAQPATASSLAFVTLPDQPKIATGFARAASRGRGDHAASAAPADAKVPAPAPNFLVSTILPLLPESLHALVLGQSAPAEAAAAMTAATQPLDPAAQMIEQQLDLAREGEWLDQLAKDIARSAGNEGGLRFRLNPENLGTLHVELTQAAAGASVRMTTDSEAARAIIADAQPRLIAEARAQGLRIAESHVDLGAGGQQAGDPRRQGELQQQPRFVRTAAAESAEAPHTPQRTRGAAERYA